MAASNAYIFSTLEKFSDGTGTDLNAFLSKFDRCCAVTNKVDGDVPIKGQLLMLFVEGRARAGLEEFELSQNGVQQTYAALVAKLKEYFDSTASRETSQILFDTRSKKLNESEEEFMLQLLRLYKTANPDHDNNITTLAVKRKFMSGISPAIRAKIFIFCNDPFAVRCSREDLLSHCRRARHLLAQPDAGSSTTDYSSERVLVNADNFGPGGAGISDNQLVAALNNITTRLDEYEMNTERRFECFEGAIASLGDYQQRGSNYRGNNYQ